MAEDDLPSAVHLVAKHDHLEPEALGSPNWLVHACTLTNSHAQDEQGGTRTG